MEVHFQPEEEARLTQIAAQRGLRADELVKQLLELYLQDEAHFIEAVNLGLSAADRGEFVDHEEVGKMLSQLLRP